tara:strand:- start:92 stop:388 length:297 start_codon:yes stop_codon:yes gene_type:complete
MKNKIKTLLENKQAKLNDWERNFVKSIYDWVNRGRTLTQKQTTTLNRLLLKNGLEIIRTNPYSTWDEQQRKMRAIDKRTMRDVRHSVVPNTTYWNKRK